MKNKMFFKILIMVLLATSLSGCSHTLMHLSNKDQAGLGGFILGSAAGAALQLPLISSLGLAGIGMIGGYYLADSECRHDFNSSRSGTPTTIESAHWDENRKCRQYGPGGNEPSFPLPKGGGLQLPQ